MRNVLNDKKVKPIVIGASSLVVGMLLFFGAQALAINNVPSGLLTQAGITNIANKGSNSGWTTNQFTCAAGFTKTQIHYDCNCSNDTTWYQCVPN